MTYFFILEISISLCNNSSFESLKISSEINPLSFKMESLLIPISIDIDFFFNIYFNLDILFGSLNNNLFKPRMYKHTPKKLNIKST